MNRTETECGRSSGVEHNLAKVRVGRSNRLARSNSEKPARAPSGALCICRTGIRLARGDGLQGRAKNPGNQSLFALFLCKHRRTVLAFTGLSERIIRLRTVVIPAAGKGTRLLPLTRVTPKELLPVYDKVVMDFAMEEAIAAGASRIVVVISQAKTAIRDYLQDHVAAAQPAPARPVAVGPWTTNRRPEVVFAFQDKPLGLGHAVLCAKPYMLPGPFGVILPDDVILGENCLAEMRAEYASGQMVAAMEVSQKDTSKYGIFTLRGQSRSSRCLPASGMVEKPAAGTAPSTLAAVGRYILDPMIFEILPRTPVGAGGELQLTDAIAIASNALPLSAFKFSGVRYDCGNHAGLLSASIARQHSLGLGASNDWAPPRRSNGSATLLSIGPSSALGEGAR